VLLSALQEGEGMNSVVRLLKQRTLSLHSQVEEHVALLEPNLSVLRLGKILKRFYGFWISNEPGIDVWSATHTDAADAVDWGRRRRSNLFARDLVALGIPFSAHAAIPRAPAVFDNLGYADVLGWLYVVEGSTLGGAVIDRHLRTLPAMASIGLESFTPYAEGPGMMWKQYRNALQEFASQDADRTSSVAAAAVATFESLDHWLLPLASEIHQ
jgi:heme oxygenase